MLLDCGVGFVCSENPNRVPAARVAAAAIVRASPRGWFTCGDRTPFVHTTLKHLHLDGLTAGDLRCDCGKLLARVLRTVLELKCPRCKRVVLVVGTHRYHEAGAGSCTCSTPAPSTGI